jgi:hypothetical protein
MGLVFLQTILRLLQQARRVVGLALSEIGSLQLAVSN